MITYHEIEVKSKLSQKRKLNQFLKALISQYRPVKRIDLTYIFCNDDYLLSINQQFLQHDTFTDIITFDLSDSDTVLQTEIYISIERVIENAQKFNCTYQQELHRVLFHGVLHICGFKDKSKADADKMRKMERYCLAAYFNN